MDAVRRKGPASGPVTRGSSTLCIDVGGSPLKGALVAAAGEYADRVSANIELPTQADLDRLAPEKTRRAIEGTMAEVAERLDEAEEVQACLVDGDHVGAEEAPRQRHEHDERDDGESEVHRDRLRTTRA